MRVFALWVVLVAWGCSDDSGSPPPDAGTSDGAVDGGTPSPFMPDQPAAPALPNLTPCPDGWRAEVDDGGTTTCEPYPEEEPPVCAPGQAAFPGEATCAPLGDVCPASGWAPGLIDDGTVLFVDDDSAGGDGSMASPFATIADALSVAREGDTIALATGTYVETVTPSLSLSIRGACAAQTVVRSPDDAAGVAAIDVAVPGISVRDVTLTGPRYGVFVHSGGTVVVDAVEVASANYFGVAVRGGHLQARRLVVRDTSAGVDGEQGVGVIVIRGGTAEIDQLVASNNLSFGVATSDAGSSVTVRNALVIDTQPSEDLRDLGNGLVANGGARLEAERIYLLRNHSSGVIVVNSTSQMLLDDVVIRDTRLQPSDGLAGSGMTLLGGVITARRVLLDRNVCGGVTTISAATLDLEDAVIRDTLPGGSDTPLGTAMTILQGTTATVRRAALVSNAVVAVLVGDPGTVLELSDARILATEPRADGLGGRGLNVLTGGRTTVTRAVVEETSEMALGALGEDAELSLTDVVVRNTHSRNLDRGPGRGLDLTEGATATGLRLRFEAQREATLFVHGDGTNATLSEVTIIDTRERECVLDSCADSGAGMGMIVLERARVDLSRFLIRNSALVGIQIVNDGIVEARDGEVSGNPIGVNVDDPAFDISALSDRVVYRDNGINLDSAALPVPDVPDTF